MMQAKNGHDGYPKPGAANGQQGRYETIENAVRVEETFKLNSKGVQHLGGEEWREKRSGQENVGEEVQTLIWGRSRGKFRDCLFDLR